MARLWQDYATEEVVRKELEFLTAVSNKRDVVTVIVHGDLAIPQVEAEGKVIEACSDNALLILSDYTPPQPATAPILVSDTCKGVMRIAEIKAMLKASKASKIFLEIDKYTVSGLYATQQAIPCQNTSKSYKLLSSCNDLVTFDDLWYNFEPDQREGVLQGEGEHQDCKLLSLFAQRSNIDIISRLLEIKAASRSSNDTSDKHYASLKIMIDNHPYLQSLIDSNLKHKNLLELLDFYSIPNTFLNLLPKYPNKDEFEKIINDLTPKQRRVLLRACDNIGNTILLLAAQNNSIYIVFYLLTLEDPYNDLDIFKTNIHGQSIFDLAPDRGAVKIMLTTTHFTKYLAKSMHTGYIKIVYSVVEAERFTHHSEPRSLLSLASVKTLKCCEEKGVACTIAFKAH